jgi:hypothetical protein
MIGNPWESEMTGYYLLKGGLLAAAVTAAISLPAAGQEAGVALSECRDLVGVYMSANYNKRPGPKKIVSRSLLTFGPDGEVGFDDSAMAGGQVFAPFSGGQGAWRCMSAEGGTIRFKATILDFTLATTDWPTQRIGRLDVDGGYDKAAATMSGQMTLSFAPFDADPLDPAVLQDSASGPFDAIRITAQ